MIQDLTATQYFLLYTIMYLIVHIDEYLGFSSLLQTMLE